MGNLLRVLTNRDSVSPNRVDIFEDFENKMDLMERIKVHKKLITERLDPDFGLLDQLLSSQSLTWPEVSEVKAVSHSYGKSEKLMEYISDKGIYEKFLEALTNSEQAHLVNFIVGNGEHCPEFGDDWPLTEREISIIDTNQKTLVDLMDTCDLLTRLYSVKVVDIRQSAFVSSKPTFYEKNEALLEILRRSSLRNYKKMIHCLHESKQSHIAEIFKEGGVVVRTHADLETETNVDEVEDELITKVTDILSDRSLVDAARILECAQLRLMAAKKGQSILLYFFCKTSAELFNLREMQTSGKLANVLRKTFNEMLSRAQVTNVTVRLSNEDFIKWENFLLSVGDKDLDKMDESLDKSDDETLTSETFVPRLSEEANQKQKSEEITECTICKGRFNDPRMLPCIHTFCLNCLTSTGEAEQKKPGEKMLCPICQKEFIIPKYGLAGLQKGFFKDTFMMVKNMQRIVGNPLTCDLCEIRNKDKTENVSTATMRCLECKYNFCESCSKVHQKLTLSEHHDIVRQIKVRTNTAAQDFVFIVGLNDTTTITNDVIQITLHRPNEISTQQQIPTAMPRAATAAVYRNTMYITGTGYYWNEIWKYTVDSGWQKCASLVQGRRRHSAAFIGEVLYICGGFVESEGRVLESVEGYNVVTNNCSIVGKLVHCVKNSGNCVPIKTSLYIFGGSDKDDNAMNHVQVYNTKLNTCTLLRNPMPHGYVLMQAALWETSVILVGCYNCFIFNFETETWKERKQFKTDVVHFGLVLENVHFGLVLENERLFVIGGGNTEKGKDGKQKWKCRDDVRYVPLRNFIEDKPVEWQIHARLPQPSVIHAYGKLTC